MTFFTTAIQLGFDYIDGVNEVKKVLSLVDHSYASAIENSLWNFDKAQLEVQLEGVLRLPGIQHIALYDSDGTLIQDVGVRSEERIITREINLFYDYSQSLERVLVGRLQVDASLQYVVDRIYKKVLVVFFTQLAKTLLVSFLIYLIFSRVLTTHLLQISRYLQKVSFAKNDKLEGALKGDLALNRKPRSSDELDILVGAINQMQRSLRLSYNELKSFNLSLEHKVQEKTHLLQEQQQICEHASRMTALGEMAGGIAHEINTPLAIISMYSDDSLALLKESQPKLAEVIDNQEAIIATVGRISKIVKALRTVSRTGESDPFERTSMTQILNDTLELCQTKIKNSGVQFDIRGFEHPSWVDGRSVQISQVLLNLLSNAFDATEGLKNAWIRIELEEKEKFVLVKVTDSGPGIAPVYQDRIMQPFFSTKPIGKGTGLGLSISRVIIEEHGGTLSLDKESPHTCFVIQLPKSTQNQFDSTPRFESAGI